MTSATVLDRPGRAARRRRRLSYVLAAVLGGIVLIAAVVAFVPFGLSPSHSGGTLGPYSLGIYNTTSVNLSFPHCSVVTVDWTIFGIGNATLVVWAQAPIQSSNCTSAAPPENTTCLPTGCPSFDTDQLVCIERGSGGSCAFLSTQASYLFWNWVPLDTGVWTGLNFTADYS